MVFYFVSFSATSVERVSSVISLKMTLESWSKSEFDVKFREELIKDGLSFVERRFRGLKRLFSEEM